MKTMKIIPGILAALAGPALAQPSNTSFDDNGGSLDDWTLAAGSAAFSAAVTTEAQINVFGDWSPTDPTHFASLWSTDTFGNDFSELSQTFAASAGDSLSFDYFFDSNAFFGFAPLDTATATISGPGGSFVLFEHNTNLGNEIPDGSYIDWTNVGFVIPQAGNWTLSFETVDGDGTAESILGVDNLIYEPLVGIPLPHAAGMGLVGLGLIGSRRRR